MGKKSKKRKRHKHKSRKDSKHSHKSDSSRRSRRPPPSQSHRSRSRSPLDGHNIIIIDPVNIDILIPILILLIHHLRHHPDHLLQVHRVQKQDQQNMSESTATERGTKPKIKISHQQTRICLAMITSKERNIHQDLHQIRQLPIMSHTQISLLLLQIRKRAEPLSMSMQIKLGPEICPKIYLIKGKYQRTRVSRLQSASLKLMVEQYPPFGRKV